MLKRDEKGLAHIVALSGGKDSTAMALRLAETCPQISFAYVCTPTGDELPGMVEHWQRLAGILGAPILPVTAGMSLKGLCAKERALPNWRMRFCTKTLKILPFKRFLLQAMPCVSYVGLRADEDDRAGADFRPSHHGGSAKLSAPGMVEQRYPLKDWGWGLAEVWAYLESRKISIPTRTDCARCFYQTLGEWWMLWRDHPEIYRDAEQQELDSGHTFRSPSRDSWPAALVDLRGEFETGRRPRGVGQSDMLRQATCRVCTL